MITWILLAGAVSGAGLLLLVVLLVPPAVQPAAMLSALDSQRTEMRLRSESRRLNPDEKELPEWLDSLGYRAAGLLRRTSLDLSGLLSDLSVLSRSLERHLVTSILLGLAGLVGPLGLVEVAKTIGLVHDTSMPVLLGLLLAVILALLPTLRLRSAAQAARRDFRHVVGSFLDLVSMSLSAGRGVPEALDAASSLSDDPAMLRIRDSLATARLRGETPWNALGRLGEDLRIDELRDLASALALVAEDGAKIRESLSARAASMRRRELALAEGEAGENSESMLVAQLVIAIGFIIFLVFPAIAGITGRV
ncbi:Flp pilus assembly protein TadB [Actinomyces bovis]|uniref:Flp pilus assembly protein TadB n=1 Tax=Actinomyces bovis TaxID=1658 RepID=A0ABY1VND9_9ACTO|nr:type II secretion system F family protein [Actinomyces bovis]SPT53625.1 Flp pilus assembly protein TadB [Actinomyces bovis]VEG55681.1 Flp pilus assembly protein TadB [Actinomyces israelii]